MAGNGSARGGLGWVILVIALAVPGVLFFNWWSHLKADREKAVAAKARGRVPDGGVFQSSPNVKLVNPMTPAVAPANAAPPAAVAVASAPAVGAGAPGVQNAAAVVPGAAPLTPPGTVQTPAPGTPPIQAPAFSSSTAAALPLKRDPTLSPFDQVRILEEEEAKRRAAEDLANAKNVKVRGPKPKPPVDPKTLVNLQGIISNTDTGFKAIVNDEVLSAGEFIGKTKIRIVKITDLGVTFDYKGKKFSKGVSRD
jgi:hypothetical protein